jgi:hypothetical protein
MTTSASHEITRADIEAKLQEIKGEVDHTAEAARVPLLALGAVAVVGLVGVAYLLGRRRGRRTTTVVEVRRV